MLGAMDFLTNSTTSAPAPDYGVWPYLAILLAWLTFGSFAVPMKSKAVIDSNVHFLVYQSNKTFWCFASAHLILFYEDYKFSPWGIVSGFLWVPAGAAAVVAVQNVGIACGQAVWQVTIMLSSLCWGLIFFHEKYVSLWGTFGFVGLLAIGVVGMTLSFNMKANKPELLEQEAAGPLAASMVSEGTTGSTNSRGRVRTRSGMSDIRFRDDDLQAAGATEKGFVASTALGLGAALFNGIWGGANLIPSKICPYHGIDFVISFGTGAAIANATMIIVYVCVAKILGWELPSPHFKVMAVPGFLSGILWSIGNFCSLYVVNTIGVGIGYTLIQSSVIVSGAWGIFYYKEMHGRPLIYWTIFCAIAVGGILGLTEMKAH